MSSWMIVPLPISRFVRRLLLLRLTVSSLVSSRLIPWFSSLVVAVASIDGRRKIGTERDGRERGEEAMGMEQGGKERDGDGGWGISRNQFDL